jgi:hypothetical protein
MHAQGQPVDGIESPHTTWLTPKQAGAVAGVSGRTIARLAASGDLVSIMTPYGRLVAPGAQLEAYAERHKAVYRMAEYRKGPPATEPSAESTGATQERKHID